MKTEQETSRAKRSINKVKSGARCTGSWCWKHKKPFIAAGIGVALTIVGLRNIIVCTPEEAFKMLKTMKG